MSFLFRPKKMKSLALAAVFLLGILACSAVWAQVSNSAIETYPDPSGQDLSAPGPIKPGEITLQDVLKAHPPAKVLQPLPTSSNLQPAPTTPPLLASPTAPSTAGTMMMQGMKSVLQQSGGTNAAATLKPPTLAGDKAGMSAATSPNPPASAVAYQPGQAPKILGSDGTSPLLAAAVTSQATGSPSPPDAVVPLDQITTQGVAPAHPAVDDQTNDALKAVTTPASSMQADIPAEQAVSTTDTAAAPAVVVSGKCTLATTTWNKTCAEAGYPESFQGEIKGETHVTCPSGTPQTQDVWVSNTCAPPGGIENPALPLSAPTRELDQPGASPSASSGAVDGSCGAVNGLATAVKPNVELCSSGEFTEVTGDGPWRWSCKGYAGGMTVSCAAPVAPNVKSAMLATVAGVAPEVRPSEDGRCGASNGVGTDHAPEADLCVKGIVSRVNGEGPWTWACSGQNGGQAAACGAPKKTDGQCGIASGAAADQMPMSDLCIAGLASAVTGNGPWNWTCSGLNGGTATTCSAAPRQDAVCGSASLNGHLETPHENLCSVGQASSVSGDGPWTWSCNGANGGSSVPCEAAPSVSGSCGSSNGVAVSDKPSENLCARGKASRVTGMGPWAWNCSGSDNGDTQSCTAPRATEKRAAPAPVASVSKSDNVNDVPPSSATVTHTTSTKTPDSICGAAGQLAALEAPEKDLCKNGTASSVIGDGPYTWTCTDGGRTSSCSTLSLSGNLETETTSSEPKSFGEAVMDKAVESTQPAAPAVATPAAALPIPPQEEKATCGPADGEGLTESPSEGLCEAGKVSKITGTGPWHWTCVKGKSKALCAAQRQIDGACGTANGSTRKTAPTSALCSAGTATDIQGTGPWLWTCVGTGGGASSSCSASAQSQTRVDGSCGAAANAASSSTPAANLCDSGVSSTVYGEGPWTWTCSGLNGGIASSCSTQRDVPPAPPPPGPPVNGLCGSSNGVAMVVQPMDNLCSTGTSTAVSGQGPWNWNCLGENSGMTVSCTAPLQPPAPITGVCGSGNGVPTLVTPRSGLCSAGISSAVSGQGPWTWSCSGTNGGGAVGCVAPLAVSGGVGSLPSMTSSSSMVSGLAPTPRAAPSGLVTPTLPSGTLPPLDTGNMPQLTPSKAFEVPPEASSLPPVPAPGEQSGAPAAAPGLPADSSPLPPPPVRDTIKPSKALKPGYDASGNLMPGNHFLLPDDVSTVTFQKGSDNFDASVAPLLDKLASLLSDNGGVRVTLTAYADIGQNTNPREARRLSLSRALAIRDYLTAKGISSGRIDVRALGANVPSGDPDRVDIKAN